LVGWNPWGCRVSDTTEQLTLSFFIYIKYVSVNPKFPIHGGMGKEDVVYID